MEEAQPLNPRLIGLMFEDPTTRNELKEGFLEKNGPNRNLGDLCRPFGRLSQGLHGLCGCLVLVSFGLLVDLLKQYPLKRHTSQKPPHSTRPSLAYYKVGLPILGWVQVLHSLHSQTPVLHCVTVCSVLFRGCPPPRFCGFCGSTKQSHHLRFKGSPQKCTNP